MYISQVCLRIQKQGSSEELPVSSLSQLVTQHEFPDNDDISGLTR